MDSTLRKPYDIFPAIERLRDHADELGPDERARLKAIAALNAADPRAVSLLVDLGGDDWAHIYPPVQPEAPITTGQAIDTFLDRYGKSTPEEDALLEKLIFNPVPEYSGVLAEAEKSEKGGTPTSTAEPTDDNIAGLAALAASINAPEPETPVPAVETPAPVANTSNRSAQAPLTLELAKIFVKQGQFDRAHEIISKIILNNPEKSVYFADQLRFLEKLIKIKQASRPEFSSTKR